MLRHRHRTGFSLIELGLVVAILVVLIGILIPVVGMVRKAARETETRAAISRLSSGIRMYYDDHRAYPGLYSNAAIAGAANDGTQPKPTSTENMVLSVAGGLQANTNFSAAEVGRGMFNFNQRNPKRWRTYVDSAPQDLSAGKIGSLDTRVPEFLDRCQAGPASGNLPILYLRAKAGAAGVVGLPTGDFQYDPAELEIYKISTLPTFGPGKNKFPNADAYFRDPAATNQARMKDTYILISAGSDGLYGTRDDITNFGNP